MGPQGRAAGEGASERPEGEPEPVSCEELPPDALAWVEHPPCAHLLERRDAALGLHSTLPGDPLQWSAAPPPPCVEGACRYELIANGGMTLVLALQARADSSVPEQLWLGGPGILADADEASRFLPLWGGERLRVDSSDFGPVYELRPHRCAGEIRLELAAREPAAALSDAPEGMRTWVEKLGAPPPDGDCRLIRGISR